MKPLIVYFLTLGHSISALSLANSKNLCAALTADESYTINSSVVDTADISSLGLEGLATGSNNFTFCRVSGKLSYGENSTLDFEVWLPEESHYHGRYLSVGNGGFGGVIDYTTMLANLNNGFAVGGCDSGHLVSENGPSKPGGYVPFLNSRAETLAWIKDSIAMFTGPAKQLTAQFYHKSPNKSYYYGCSTGGAQGYALAQYHPEIFDGVFAGSAGNWYSHLILSFLWNGLHANEPGAFLDQGALNFTRDAVVKACDSIDGVRDGVIDDPTKCNFDIESIACRSGQASVANNATVCLNSTQIATAKAIYAGPGSQTYPGFAKGGESEWLVQETILYVDYAVPILQNLVFKNLSYDYKSFDFNRDVGTVDEVAGPLITATSPKLDAFRARGGKLIATQGWADPYNAPFWPIDQHKSAQAIYGNEVNDWWRLFMVPGGGHCGSAFSYPQVPGTWNTLDKLVPWVEKGEAPSHVVATTPADGSSTTKRLCPYPQHAVYQHGRADDYKSYKCE